MNNFYKSFFRISFPTILIFSFAGQVFAADKVGTGINNPVIDKALGNDLAGAQNGNIFSSYVITIWRALIVIGALAVLLNFVTGALNWITAGGEQAKVQKARQQIENAVIGMVILAFSFVIITYVLKLFGIDLVTLTIPTPS